MALLPLNTFKTKTAIIHTLSSGTTATTVYTAPIGVTAIILMTQVASVSTETHAITFAHHRNLPVLPDAQGNGGQSANVSTELITDYLIPPNDAASLTTGKLVVESLDSIRCYADADAVFKLTIGVLETANA
jgi:hypothetical protein